MNNICLLGSDKQPSNFIKPDGEQFTLGDVVREAQMRSRLSVQQWNKMVNRKNEMSERLIAAVVKDWELEPYGT